MFNSWAACSREDATAVGCNSPCSVPLLAKSSWSINMVWAPARLPATTSSAALSPMTTTSWGATPQAVAQ